MLRNLNAFIHEIPADATDAKVNEILRRHEFEETQEISRTGRDLIKELKKKGERPEDYEARLNEWVERSNELGKSSLARYVAHRKVMLDFLEESLRQDKDTGKFRLEEVVHKIIYPMRTTSDEVRYDQQNLWMIDEKLAFHQFLTSDKRLDQTAGLQTESQLRPDLMVFQSALLFKEDDNVLDSLVVVEFKKPGRSDYSSSDNPIDQAVGLVHEIRRGRARLEGRQILVRSPKIPAWAYIVCDLTDPLRELASGMRGFLPTTDALGLYNYMSEEKIYIEIIPYDKLLMDARKGNRVLFRSLNIEQ